jgi:membrane associated rhomboid family serine protease
MNDNNFGENQNENEHDLNAININNNQNNINQNQINNQDNNTFNIFSKFPEITISYLIFFIINIIIFIYSQFLPLEKTTFVFQYRPVTSKNQLYRLITRYFIHFGFAHLILEQVTFFYLTKYFESKFGTLLTLSIIFVSMILVSIINILIIPIFSLFLSYRVSILLDHAYEGGLTPMIFAMVTYFSLFKKNRHERLLLNNFFLLRVKYSYLYLLGILYFFTPNRSFYGNVSGIFGGFILKKYRNIFLPKLIWIFDLEKNSCLNHIKNLYKKININNNEMINMLKEYDKDSLDDIIFNYQIMNTNGDK